MSIENIMSRPVHACGPDTSLAEAALQMWKHDCGILPVLGREGRLVGVITDRDICIAVGTKHRRADDIRVHEVMTPDVTVVKSWDTIHTALQTLRGSRIHRVPVTDEHDRLVGMLSMNDIALAATPNGRNGVAYDEVITTLKTVYQHEQLVEVAST